MSWRSVWTLQNVEAKHKKHIPSRTVSNMLSSLIICEKVSCGSRLRLTGVCRGESMEMEFWNSDPCQRPHVMYLISAHPDLVLAEA